MLSPKIGKNRSVECDHSLLKCQIQAMETVHIKTRASTGVNWKNVKRRVRCQRVNGFYSEKRYAIYLLSFSKQRLQ